MVDKLGCLPDWAVAEHPVFLVSVWIEAHVGSIGNGDFFTEVSTDPASHHLNEFAEAADRSPYRPELKPQDMVFPEAPWEYGPEGTVSVLHLHFSHHWRPLSHVLHTLRWGWGPWWATSVGTMKTQGQPTASPLFHPLNSWSVFFLGDEWASNQKFPVRPSRNKDQVSFP